MDDDAGLCLGGALEEGLLDVRVDHINLANTYNLKKASTHNLVVRRHTQLVVGMVR